MSREFKNHLSGVQSNILLKNYSTFRIGGRARYFFVAGTNKELIRAVNSARENSLPFFILGGGSNLLMSDKDFKGLVIKVQTLKSKVAKDRIFAEAGLSAAKLASIAAESGLSGLEWLYGIPGTVGGAVRGNAGAFHQSMQDAVEKVEAYDVEKGKIKVFKNKECDFSNKLSIFKKNPNLIILSCTVKLKKGKRPEIEKKMGEYADYRRRTQPLGFASIGCIFKNYPFDKKTFDEKTFEEFPELKDFLKRKLIPAGYLIDRCNLKGKKVNGAKVSEKHANFIINTRDAKAKDVKKLIEFVKNRIKKKFKTELQEEIEYFNF